MRGFFDFRYNLHASISVVHFLHESNASGNFCNKQETYDDTTCARGAIISAKLTCHVAISSCRLLAQSFKGTLINLPVVVFCVEFLRCRS